MANFLPKNGRFVLLSPCLADILYIPSELFIRTNDDENHSTVRGNEMETTTTNPRITVERWIGATMSDGRRVLVGMTVDNLGSRGLCFVPETSEGFLLNHAYGHYNDVGSCDSSCETCELHDQLRSALRGIGQYIFDKDIKDIVYWAYMKSIHMKQGTILSYPTTINYEMEETSFGVQLFKV